MVYTKLLLQINNRLSQYKRKNGKQVVTLPEIVSIAGCLGLLISCLVLANNITLSKEKDLINKFLDLSVIIPARSVFASLLVIGIGLCLPDEVRRGERFKECVDELAAKNAAIKNAYNNLPPHLKAYYDLKYKKTIDIEIFNSIKQYFLDQVITKKFESQLIDHLTSEFTEENKELETNKYNTILTDFGFAERLITNLTTGYNFLEYEMDNLKGEGIPQVSKLMNYFYSLTIKCIAEYTVEVLQNDDFSNDNKQALTFFVRKCQLVLNKVVKSLFESLEKEHEATEHGKLIAQKKVDLKIVL